jgi:hypothetical protein
MNPTALLIVPIGSVITTQDVDCGAYAWKSLGFRTLAPQSSTNRLVMVMTVTVAMVIVRVGGLVDHGHLGCG